MAQDTGDTSVVREVWAHNVVQEIHLMQMILEQEKHLFASIDTEFPGTVLRAPEGLNWWGQKWEELRSNVDNLRLIQFGVALSDAAGRPPPGCGVWQFNFEFDVDRELHAQDSIALLRQNGCDFRKHATQGICPLRFGELLVSSGLVLNENVQWISFHGGYDFAYLVKVLTAEALPPRLGDMLGLVDLFFPQRCDIKYLLRDQYRGGLTALAVQMRVGYAGAHQAGLDAVLTRDVFFRLGHAVTQRAFDARQADFAQLVGLGGDLSGRDPAAVGRRTASFSPAMWRQARQQWVGQHSQRSAERAMWEGGYMSSSGYGQDTYQGSGYYGQDTSYQPQNWGQQNWGQQSWGNVEPSWGGMSAPQRGAGELVY